MFIYSGAMGMALSTVSGGLRCYRRAWGVVICLVQRRFCGVVARRGAPALNSSVESGSSPGLRREVRMSATRGGGGEAGELHVLAVDDSSVSRKLIEKLLRGSLYRVTVVDSGKRALELLGAGKENGSSSKGRPNVNLIITDYSMPEMTGYELLKRVKGSSALRDIPVVIMSSENLPNRVSRCMEEGAEDFLLKPLRPADVPRLMSIMSGSTK